MNSTASWNSIKKTEEYLGVLSENCNSTTMQELLKIDNGATDGLSGVYNSLSYRIAEVERHFHSYERWYGLAGTPSGETHRMDSIGIGVNAFSIDGGNNNWGSWVQIVGSSDTSQRFDLHRIKITNIERDNSVHFVQIACGATGDGAITAGTYTECVYKPQSTGQEEAPVDIQMRRQAAGTKVWARVLVLGQNTGIFDFYIGIHYYEG